MSLITQNKYSFENYFYSFFIVIFPLLTIYRSPIPGLRLSTLLLFLITPVLIEKSLTRNTLASKTSKLFFLLCLYLFCSTTLSVLFGSVINNDVSLIFFRLFNFIIIPTLGVFIFSKRYFDLTLGLKILINISIVSSIFLIFQTTVFYTTGKLLSGVFLSFVDYAQYAENDYSAWAKHLYRPTSFFTEPAHFCQFAFVGLVYSLFGNEYIQNRNLKAIVISTAMILSTSVQGIILVFLIWVIFIFSKSRQKKNKLFYTFLGIFLMTVIIITVFQFDFFVKAIDRAITLNANGGNAFLARTSSISDFMALPVIHQIFGVGFGNPIPEQYFNSISYALYCTGVIGLILMFILFIPMYKQSFYFQKVTILLLIMLFFGSHLFTATSIMFYFPFLINIKNKKIKNEPIS